MGSKKSSTSTNTTNEFFDNRSVNDAGGGVAGSGNVWDQSVNAIDNRSNTNSGNTTWTQNTKNTDSSTRSYENSGNTTWNSTDGGAFALVTDVSKAQTEAARAIAMQSISAAQASSQTAAAAALKAQENAIASTNAVSGKAFDFASATSQQAFKSSAEALGFAGEKFDTLAGLASDVMKTASKNADSAAAGVKEAYSSAASQANGNKTLTIAAIAAVGLVAVVLMMKKG